MFMDEQDYGMTMLSLLVAIYGALSLYVTNPIYDLVYNYVLTAIWSNLDANPSEAPTLKEMMPGLLGINVTSTLLLTIKAIMN